MKSLPKLLLVSYAPGGATGFGNQAAILYEAATAAGWQVAVAQLCMAPTEFPPRVIHADGMIATWICPTPMPNETVGYILAEYRPDAVLMLCELWQVQALLTFPGILERTHAWLAPDHERIFPGAAAQLDRMASVTFASRFALAGWGPSLHRPAGALPAAYIPHGVDCDFFRPVEPERRQAWRSALGIDDPRHFVAAHVGKNCWRKQQPALIDGWARFVAGRIVGGEDPRCTLFLHADPVPKQQPDAMGFMVGTDMPAFIADNYPPEVARTIRFSEPNVRREGLLALYNAADVHVLASCGEGFGIPLVEAQACGTPNIAANNTSTPEILAGASGHAVGCSSFQVQPGTTIKRPMIDPHLLADALACCAAGPLPEKLREARVFVTRGRYDRAMVKSMWTEHMIRARDAT